MIVKNPNSLLGDFLGTVPALQALKEAGRGQQFVQYEPSVNDIANAAKLIAYPKWLTPDLILDLQAAFNYAAANNLHMTQAWFYQLGLPVPSEPVRPVLNFPKPDTTTPVYDYILSPFSRSLPLNQRWHGWQELIKAMPDKKFAVIGASEDVSFFDDAAFYYGLPFNQVAAIMQAARCGLVSVITGTSHLAHALGVKNFLLDNQSPGKWGVNPDAIKIQKHIPDLTVADVVTILKQHDNG